MAGEAGRIGGLHESVGERDQMGVVLTELVPGGGVRRDGTDRDLRVSREKAEDLAAGVPGRAGDCCCPRHAKTIRINVYKYKIERSSRSIAFLTPRAQGCTARRRTRSCGRGARAHGQGRRLRRADQTGGVIGPESHRPLHSVAAIEAPHSRTASRSRKSPSVAPPTRAMLRSRRLSLSGSKRPGKVR